MNLVLFLLGVMKTADNSEMLVEEIYFERFYVAQVGLKFIILLPQGFARKMCITLQKVNTTSSFRDCTCLGAVQM